MFKIYREPLEYLVFGSIFFFQIYFFVRSVRRVHRYKKALPEVSHFKTATVNFADEDSITKFVNIVTPANELIDETDLTEWMKESADGGVTTPPIAVTLIKSQDFDSPVTDEIVGSINKYLARNRHSVADFNLMKDIVERNTDVLEDEINLTLSTPLYLGLMGTMFGIILGIISMSNFYTGQVDDKILAVAISVLLSSVKAAMSTSCFGLFLTILNSAVIFKSTKYHVEARKNEFYTFLQVSLVPLLNQGIGATFDSLQRNLAKFNDRFDHNLSRLTGVFNTNYESLLLYKELLDQLDRSKVAEITKFNVDVLKQLNISVAQFQRFNEVFANLDHYINSTFALADKSTELLKRTDNFEKIAGTIEENLNLNAQFTRYLADHFANLEKHGQRVDQAADIVSFSIKDTFEVLMRSVAAYSQELTAETANRNIEMRKVFDGFSTEIRNSLVTQTEAFRSSMAEQTDLFNASMQEKKSKLDYLETLEPLLAEVKAQRQSPQSTDSGRLHAQLSELTNVMSASLRYLKRIEKNSKTPFFMKIFSKTKHEEE